MATKDAVITREEATTEVTEAAVETAEVVAMEAAVVKVGTIVVAEVNTVAVHEVASTKHLRYSKALWARLLISSRTISNSHLETSKVRFSCMRLDLLQSHNLALRKVALSKELRMN